MAETVTSVSRPLGQAVTLTCRDGVVLHGHVWPARGQAIARIIINPATGVLARYYLYYADFLAGEGFEVLTHRRVPAGDGGIAYGQAAVAARRMSLCA